MRAGVLGCRDAGPRVRLREALENIKDAIETYLAAVEDLLGDEVTRVVEVPA